MEVELVHDFHPDRVFNVDFNVLIRRFVGVLTRPIYPGPASGFNAIHDYSVIVWFHILVVIFHFFFQRFDFSHDVRDTFLGLFEVALQHFVIFHIHVAPAFSLLLPQFVIGY